MISPEAIKLLNSILYDFPTDGMFSVSDYTADKKDGHSFDKEIADFLLAEGFVKFIRGNILSREKEHREFTLTDKGIKLQECGSYEKYVDYTISEFGRLNQLEKEGSQMAHRQSILAERQVWINIWIAVGVSVAGIYYSLEIRQHHPGFYNRTFYYFLSIGIVILLWKILSWLLHRKGKTK